MFFSYNSLPLSFQEALKRPLRAKVSASAFVCKLRPLLRQSSRPKVARKREKIPNEPQLCLKRLGASLTGLCHFVFNFFDKGIINHSLNVFNVLGVRWDPTDNSVSFSEFIQAEVADMHVYTYVIYFTSIP